jgi:type IV pilus assembly protein PilZ
LLADVAKQCPVERKRQHIRVSLRLAVLCQPKQGNPFGGVVADLGLGGARITSSQIPPPGALEIAARLPGSPNLSHLPATVRWMDGGGFGVQFGLLGARDTKAIAELRAQALRRQRTGA